MMRQRWNVLTALVAMATCGPVLAVETVATRSFVLRAGRVYPVVADQPWVIESGVIIVRDGRIVAVGHDLPLPPDLPVIDLPDATVMPGLVLAASSLAPPHSGDESIAAAYLAVDAYLPYGNYQAALAGGVTTVHLHPGEHRLVTGQGGVVKLGGPIDNRVLRFRADLTVNFRESAYRPPRDVTYQTPSSSDVAIPPAVRQRPDSRLGQFLALDEALALSEPVEFVSFQLAALARAWQSGVPLRVQVQREADIEGALMWLKRRQRSAYLVGGAEADRAVDAIRQAKVPLVFQMAPGIGGSVDDIGFDPDALDADIRALEKLSDIKLALAISAGQSVGSFRSTASVALRAGLTSQQVIESITRVPAEILGVDDRVGSLAPGMDADLIVVSGDPLDTNAHVLRTYIAGELAFEAPEPDALVVRAGTIWINEERRIDNGAILIEDGRITAVGTTVPHPPFARVIDAGPGGFVTPGFIDAYGHLGLASDRSTPGLELQLAKLVGAVDVTDRRVARAGITTVVLSPYKASSQGSQISAIKTAGTDREKRVLRGTAGVMFDLSKTDPMTVEKSLVGRLEAGKKYLEKWQKYEKELAEWKEKKAKGEDVDGKPEREDEEEAGKPDPITGTWETMISGGPIPEPQNVTMRLKLEGTDIEGRIAIPGEEDDVKIVATLDGTHISGHIEIDTGGMGHPEIEADIVEEDHIVGKISFQGLEVDLEARRTDKEAVEFKVVKRRTRGKGGRPLPPKVDEALEPLKSVIEKMVPLVISVRTPAQVAAVLKVREKFDVPIVLLNADDAATFAEQLVEHSVGVIVRKQVVRWVNDRPYHQADDLTRKGVAVAFQSDAEDGARALPLMALHAVQRGLSADAALAAFTTHASRMFKLDALIGSLEPGKHGDIVIFNGHPFMAGTSVQRVIINGEEVR